MTGEANWKKQTSSAIVLLHRMISQALQQETKVASNLSLAALVAWMKENLLAILRVHQTIRPTLYKESTMVHVSEFL